MNTYTLNVGASVKSNSYTVIEFKDPIQNLEKLATIKFDVSPTDSSIEIDYRYSKDGQTWSEWRDWPSQENISNEFIFLGFRLKANVDLLINSLTIEWIGGELGDNENVTCSCVTTNLSGECGFLTNCNSSALYATATSGLAWWEQMAQSVFNNLGWTVIYFKCNEIEESRDVIFKEWSLLKVDCCKKIKVIVPNNDFNGEGEVQFMESDMDFADLEVEIHKESFWASFGAGEQPAEKDFLYFPLERRMYRVNSVFGKKSFMRQVQWWKANLIKWNESDSIYKSDGVKEVIDDITLNFEEEFGEEKFEEEIDIVKPQQYTVRRIADSDNCRENINIDWEKKGIIEENLENYYTVFSKFQYDLNFGEPKVYAPVGITGATGATGATASDVIKPIITYQNEIDAGENFAIMNWLNPQPRANNLNEYLTLYDGEVQVNTKANANEFTGLIIGDNEFNFNLPVNQWYAIYIGNNKDLNELTLRIWKRKDNASKTTKMEILVEQTIPPVGLAGAWNVGLMPNGDKIASIRFLSEVMTVENQSTSFNRLVFREDSKAYIIDDCYPMSYLGYLSNK